METYLFYTTHLVMTVCIALVISASMPETKLAYMKRISELVISLFSIRKTTAHLAFKTVILNLLTIGLQIATQLLR